MAPHVPYGVRALALSHARAWPTAAWTAAATAVVAGLALSPVQWAALAGLALVCGSAVRMAAAQLVGAWLSLHADLGGALAAAEPASDYDAATLGALRSLVPPAPPS